MQVSMYEFLVPVANRMLGNLALLLDKADEFAAAKKIEPAVLLGSRLAPDMFPLTRQVQIACDMVKGAVARLSATDIPSFADTETNIAELKGRITRTLDFANGIDAAKFDGSEDRDIVIAMRTGELRFKGLAYLRDFVLPNVYFHVGTSYLILRHNGVEIGKNDFIGKQDIARAGPVDGRLRSGQWHPRWRMANCLHVPPSRAMIDDKTMLDIVQSTLTKAGGGSVR